MRESFVETITSAENDDLLTTGEVAKLLGVSRQHVVDMCDRGDIPFVTVGTHRRIRRSDVLQAQARTNRLNRDQLRSLWLNHAVAGRVVEDPEKALRLARQNLEVHRQSRRSDRWTGEWVKLVEGPIERVLLALTSPTPLNRELRQNSPFAGLLSEDERARVLGAFNRVHPGGSRAS